jgi:hypothetical protein
MNNVMIVAVTVGGRTIKIALQLPTGLTTSKHGDQLDE